MDELFYGRINGIYLISYVCLIRFLQAVNFVLVKPKCLSLFLSYLLLNNYWAM